MFRLIRAIIFIVVKYKLISCTTIKHKPECGYKQCPQTRDGALNVHLIPHSHMDAGWVKTFDEYYHGTRTSISTANVQLIFHSVLSELLHDKRRKFVLSETAYFWRWWKEQRPVTRSTFRTLIQEGRIEFAGGGWVQNDEATVDYLQIIDQYTWGLRKINDTLGPCGKPKAGWQIDTYGHSREQASLLAQMGYDGLFIGRVDYKERESMIEEDRMEYMWRGSDVLGKMSDIMTHTLFNLYNAPDGFCFDFLCNDEPIVEDPDSKVFNADKRVNDFIAQIERQAKYYEHDNILVTMGGDFTFQSAASWYMNMDKLINHVNTHTANLSDINIFYSTPSCYLKSVYLYGRRDKAIYTERGDDFPYGSDTTTYWTGFFSSRPTVKYFAKRGHLFLQVVKQLTVISRTGDSYELHLLRHAVSLILHHDAITVLQSLHAATAWREIKPVMMISDRISVKATNLYGDWPGTSQQHVTDDFVKTLHDAIDTCTKKISNLLSYLTPTWGGSRRSKNNQQFVVCHQLNMSQCEFTETHEAMLLLIYNPSSVKTYYTVRLPAIAMQYSIRDANDDELEYQLLPLPAAIINLPGRTSPAIQELVFEAENIPPIGFSAFYLTPVRDQLEESQFARKAQQSNTAGEQELLSFISNEYLKVSLDKNTGLLDSIQHVDGARIIVSQNYYVYSQGQPSMQSGSYSFRPAKDRPMPVTNHVTYHAVRGNLVKEIRQRFTDWITQIIRLYRGEEFVEIEWIIGPVPIDDMGKEVVSIFATNISNGGDFFTDSNGRQMVKRSCLNLTNSQRPLKPVPACYFPVTSRICIHSSNSSIEMCVLTDRAQGGTSYNNGDIELMVHRRLLTDDGFGLEEPLNEESHGVGLVVRGKHRIIFGNYKSDVDELTFSERTAQAARRWDLEPWTFMTPGEKVNRRKWQNVRNKRFTALRPHGLPRHIHILTLEPWKAGSVLLRLENTLQNGRLRHDKSDNAIDYHTKSSHITVELSKLFAQLQIKTVRETTLAANQWLEDARQMDWSTRYVYSGADDGLLPEDAELTEDNKLKQKDKDTGSEPSDEDRDFMHKSHHSRPKIPRKSRAKIKSTTFLRKRRSLNVTDSIFENLTNDTYDRNKDEYTFMNKFFDGVANATVKAKTDNTTAVYTNNTKDGTIDSNSLDKIGIVTSTAKTKLNYKGLAKNTKLLSEFQKESDELSEEDALSKLRKRSARRRFAMPAKKNMDLDQFDESDDEITKSIYEMYYKSKPRLTKTWSKHDDETDVQPKRKSKAKRFKNDYEDEDDRVTRKYRISNKRRRGRIATSTAKPERRFRSSRKGIREGGNSRERDRHEDFGRDFDLAFGRNEKPKPSRHKPEPKPKAEDEDDIPMDFEEDMDDERMEAEFEEGRYKRKKRQSSKDERDDTTTERDRERDHSDSENEYLITLRPSQIRTFVIWFENTRKTYTM